MKSVLEHSNSVYKGSPGLFMDAFVLIAAIALVVSLVSIIRSKDLRALYRHFVFWTIVPALWFSVEYAQIYGRWGDKTKFTEFKHGQDLSAKVWAAIVAIITAKVLTFKGVPHVELADKPGEKKTAG